jgi:hypothetical protein
MAATQEGATYIIQPRKQAEYASETPGSAYKVARCKNPEDIK